MPRVKKYVEICGKWVYNRVILLERENTMNNRFKPTVLEKSWILYDVGNSAFTLLVSTLLPIYFNALATAAGINENMYLSYWGYAGSIATIIVAFIGPICGTLSDRRGYKKPIFLLCVLLGVLGCAALGIAENWLVFLGIFIIGKVGFHSSLVFYDSMLPEITSDDRIDNVSSHGYAWGYIGSVIPFVICLVLVLAGSSFGLSQGNALSGGSCSLCRCCATTSRLLMWSVVSARCWIASVSLVGPSARPRSRSMYLYT